MLETTGRTSPVGARYVEFGFGEKASRFRNLLRTQSKVRAGNPTNDRKGSREVVRQLWILGAVPSKFKSINCG